MMKTVVYTRVALRRTETAPGNSRQDRPIRRANPAALANNVIQLTDSPAKRLRIAGFRVLFTETDTTITILDLGPRGEM